MAASRSGPRQGGVTWRTSSRPGTAPFARRVYAPLVCETDETVLAGENLSFDDFVDLLRERVFDAEAVKSSSQHHSFKELMSDCELVPEQWYWQAFADLEAQGHLAEASSKLNGGDADAGLSAEGRFYVRSGREELAIPAGH
jgi:hypothetical protein